MASAMSPQRRGISDRSGIRNLGGYLLTDTQFKSIRRHQVDGSIEAKREVLFEFDEGEEPDRPGELDEDVDVACLGPLAAYDRAEDADPAD